MVKPCCRALQVVVVVVLRFCMDRDISSRRGGVGGGGMMSAQALQPMSHAGQSAADCHALRGVPDSTKVGTAAACGEGWGWGWGGVSTWGQ